MNKKSKAILKNREAEVADKTTHDYRTVQFVMAPTIPLSELLALEIHWQEALDDPKYTIITNYDVRIEEHTYDRKKQFLSVIADSIPASEVTVLKRKVHAALRTKNGIVFTNYMVHPEVLDATGTVIPTRVSKKYLNWMVASAKSKTTDKATKKVFAATVERLTNGKSQRKNAQA